MQHQGMHQDHVSYISRQLDEIVSGLPQTLHEVELVGSRTHTRIDSLWMSGKVFGNGVDSRRVDVSRASSGKDLRKEWDDEEGLLGRVEEVKEEVTCLVKVRLRE